MTRVREFDLSSSLMYFTRRSVPEASCVFVLVALCALVTTGVTRAEAQAGDAVPVATTPPVPKSGLRLPDIQLHDPWMIADRSTRTYYLYSSASRRITGEGRTGTLFYTSNDLATWEGPFIAFVAPTDSWADPAVNAWAPEVHAYKGKYYLFTTLHNPKKLLPTTDSTRPNTMRATIVAVSDSPRGPFVLTKNDAPITPANFMTLDGTLYVDRAGKPWMVYAHEWIQKVDGTMEAIPLNDDLSEALWASYMKNELGRNGYVQTVARSKSGELNGPWEQLTPLIGNDSGHGMLFLSFDGKLMLVLHQPFQNARGKIYEMEDMGDHLRVVKYREDLSGPPLPPLPGQAPRGQAPL